MNPTFVNGDTSEYVNADIPHYLGGLNTTVTTNWPIPDPRWEMPALLYPGRKPVGEVRIDFSLIPKSFGRLHTLLLMGAYPEQDLVEKNVRPVLGTGGFSLEGGSYGFHLDSQHLEYAAEQTPLTLIGDQKWIISFTIEKDFTDGESGLVYVVRASIWSHVSVQGVGDLSEIGVERSGFEGFGIYRTDLREGTNRITIVGDSTKEHACYVNDSIKGVITGSSNMPYNLRYLTIGGAGSALPRYRGPGRMQDVMIFGSNDLNLPADSDVFAFNRDPYQFLRPA